MPKSSKEERLQLGVRISPEAWRTLEQLQEMYAKRAGLTSLTQSQAVEMLIHEAGKTLTKGKG